MQQTINGVKINWREAGAGDAVIFIHGFPFDSRMWAAQLAAVPDGWRFIAPDLRGFGASEAGSEPFTMELLANDMVGLLDHLNIDQAVVVGLSMGGYIAFSLADQHADRVRGLVLAATRANADSAEASNARHELAARTRSEGVQPVIDAMLPKLVAGQTRMQRPQVVEEIRAMMESAQPQSMARALEAMATRKDHAGGLSNINVSTMIVRGDQDEIIPAGDMELIARSVRGTRHEVMQNVGHLPNMESADVFNTTLHHFLKHLPPAMKLGDLTLNF